MSYATVTDLNNSFSAAGLAALADDDNDGVADVPILESALLVAEAFIDQQLGARYATPLAAPPTIVQWWCTILALEALHNRSALELPARLRNDADLARRALEAIHDGLAALSGAVERPQALLADITRGDDEATFNLEKLEWY